MPPGGGGLTAFGDGEEFGLEIREDGGLFPPVGPPAGPVGPAAGINVEWSPLAPAFAGAGVGAVGPPAGIAVEVFAADPGTRRGGGGIA